MRGNAHGVVLLSLVVSLGGLESGVEAQACSPTALVGNWVGYCTSPVGTAGSTYTCASGGCTQPYG